MKFVQARSIKEINSSLTPAPKELGFFILKRKDLYSLSIFLLKKLFRYNESKHLFLDYYAVSYFSKTIYRRSFYLLFLKIAIPAFIIHG